MIVMHFLLFDQGTVETLSYFSKRIAEQLQILGHEVLFFDIVDETKKLPKLISYLKNNRVVLLTFNFSGLQREAIFYDKAGRLFWNLYEVVCVNIIVDHPLYYYKELKELPKHYLQFCIDFGHETYMRTYYPKVVLGSTMPLPGSEYRNDGNKETISDVKPISMRSMNVSFTGNYTPSKHFEQYITRLDSEYERFYRSILDEFRSHPERELDEVFSSHIKREMGELLADQMTQAFHSLMFLDMSIRFFYRGEVIRLLTESGITVHTFGAGWDLLETKGRKQLICHGSRNTEGCLKALADTKVSLNVMPWFKQGSHDRIYNSMRNGAVSVTDTSRYLVQTLTDNKNVVFYELTKLEQLPQKVKNLLTDENQMQRIAEEGYQHVMQYHTWEQYTKSLLSIIGNVNLLSK